MYTPFFLRKNKNNPVVIMKNDVIIAIPLPRVAKKDKRPRIAKITPIVFTIIILYF